MNTNQDLTQYLVREANRLGRRGTKIMAWIPPQSATQDAHGAWVTAPRVMPTASQGEED